MDVSIHYDEKRLKAFNSRIEAVENFERPDRVPCIAVICQRYLMEMVAGGYTLDYFQSAEKMANYQISFAKWRSEHVFDDSVVSEVSISPYFENISESGGLGCEIHWTKGNPPRSIPFMKEPEDVDRWEVPDWENGEGLWGNKLKYYWDMVEYAKSVAVTINGKHMHPYVTYPGRLNLAPVTVAVDMVGMERLWSWMFRYPDVVHRLLSKVVDEEIKWEKYCRSLIDPKPQGIDGLSDDAAATLSPKLFREYSVPYLNRIYDAFPGMRGLHMCGNFGHQIDIYLRNLKITHLQSFGYQVDPAIIGEKFGGRVVMSGNISPMVIFEGPPSRIMKAAKHAIESLAPHSGFILQDGANICPGTSIRNLRVMLTAVEKYGKYEDFGT
jgi:uroporphyrinogen-III decarboxylase